MVRPAPRGAAAKGPKFRVDSDRDSLTLLTLTLPLSIAHEAYTPGQTAVGAGNEDISDFLLSLSNVTYFRVTTRIVQGESVYKEAMEDRTVAAAEPSPAHPLPAMGGVRTQEEGESRSVPACRQMPLQPREPQPKVTLQGESQGINTLTSLSSLPLWVRLESKRRPGSRYPVMSYRPPGGEYRGRPEGRGSGGQYSLQCEGKKPRLRRVGVCVSGDAKRWFLWPWIRPQ